MASHNEPPQAVVIPTLSLMCIFLNIPPLLWHWKNRNFPASCLVSWLLISNLFNAVNAFIWPTDNTESWWDGVGLCDVEVKIITASYLGLPTALMCIFRNLANALNTNDASLAPNTPRRMRNFTIEVTFCLGLPAIFVVTNYIVQNSRYLIFQIAGCAFSVDQSWPSLVLSFLPPVLVCLAATYFCLLISIRFFKYKSQFGAILRTSDSSMSKSRFLRLFTLAFIMLLVVLPLQIYVLYSNIQSSLPWHAFSWSEVHGPDWDFITKASTNGNTFYDRWIPMFGSVLVFLFFGTGPDAATMYSSFLRYLGLSRYFPSLSHARDRHRYSNRPWGNPVTSSDTLIGSFSNRLSLLFCRAQSPVPRNSRSSGIPARSNVYSLSDVDKELCPSPVIYSDGPSSCCEFCHSRPWSPIAVIRIRSLCPAHLSQAENGASTTVMAVQNEQLTNGDNSSISPANHGNIMITQEILQASEPLR